MHRCGGRSSSQGHGGCSCGLFQGVSSQGSSPGSFSILFAMPNRSIDQERQDDGCNFLSSFSSPSVDCTLSLGTPSTRQAGCQKPQSPSCFGWESIACETKQSAPARGVGGGGGLPNGNLNLGGDSLLARRCANCDTTSTPLWRNGPRGPKSLCNACGIRYKKEERRAAATSLTSASSPTPPAVSGATVETQQHLMGYGYQNYQQQQQQQPWSYPPMSRVTSARQGFMLVEDHNREYRRSGNNDEEEDGDLVVDPASLPYFSWRLNVHPSSADRPGLLHDLSS